MSPAEPLAAVSVPATTANLGPGFDAFGAALSLRATFAAVPRGEQPRVASRGAGGPDLPTGDDNLVWRSLLAACARFGWDQPDVAIEVETPIPQARGMGSSSAAIVGGIALARVLAGADASVAPGPRAADRTGAEGAVAGMVGLVGDVELTQLAAELEGHPDNVAPAIHGGLVACATTDEGAAVVRLAPPPASSRPVLLVPAISSLTSESRGVVPQQLATTDVTVQAARAGHVLAGLTGAWPVDARLAGDRLHEPPRTAGTATGDLLVSLRDAGLHAWLSGAGPSVAVALGMRDERALELVRTVGEQAGHAVHVLDWDRQGIRSCVQGGCGVAGSPGCADCPLPSLR